MKRIAGTVLGAITAITMLTASVPATVHAAGGLSMSTTYPGIETKAGSSLSYSLDFDNETGSGANTALSTASIPDGWSGYFTGSGNTISNVYLQTGMTDGAATYSLSIPDDAEAGVYKIALKATGNDASSTLNLTVTISEEETGASNMETEYAEQEGATGSTFSFSSTIQNNSADPQTYSFSNNAPDGWQVKITPSGESTQVASIDVDAHSSQALSITITPPDSVDAGEYEIPISAISATETLSTTLKVTITGTYALSVAGSNGILSFDAVANEKSTVTLVVTNDGNVDLEDIELSSSTPDDWTVEFSESSIDSLAAGASKEISMYVTPSDDALSGDYELDITAKNTVKTATAAFRVTVETSTTWGVVGVVLIVAVIGCIFLVFKKFGRH